MISSQHHYIRRAPFPQILAIRRWTYLFSSVTQLCLTLCDPIDCITPGLPVHPQLPELAQPHVHRVGDAIQPSHPLSPPSPLAFTLPASGSSFPTSQFFLSGGQSIGASASILPINIQDWFRLGLRSNQSQISPEYSLEGLMLKLKLPILKAIFCYTAELSSDSYLGVRRGRGGSSVEQWAGRGWSVYLLRACPPPPPPSLPTLHVVIGSFRIRAGLPSVCRPWGLERNRSSLYLALCLVNEYLNSGDPWMICAATRYLVQYLDWILK